MSKKTVNTSAVGNICVLISCCAGVETNIYINRSKK